MSLESKIEMLNESINKLIAALSGQGVGAQAIKSTPAPTEAPTPAPTQAPKPTEAPAPTMPPAPSFMATPTPSVGNVPFNDGPGLTKYVMDSYKAMGPEKGALIQNVLTGLGYQNINDIQPHHYAALYTGVEGLKG